jgi:hypothetical protein
MSRSTPTPESREKVVFRVFWVAGPTRGFLHGWAFIGAAKRCNGREWS